MGKTQPKGPSPSQGPRASCSEGPVQNKSDSNQAWEMKLQRRRSRPHLCEDWSTTKQYGRTTMTVRAHQGGKGARCMRRRVRLHRGRDRRKTGAACTSGGSCVIWRDCCRIPPSLGKIIMGEDHMRKRIRAVRVDRPIKSPGTPA